MARVPRPRKAGSVRESSTAGVNGSFADYFGDFRGRFSDGMRDGEKAGVLQRALSTLSFEQRSTLTLAYQLGCAPEEIALITGVPVGSVEARMRCAHEKLHRRLPAGKRRIPQAADRRLPADCSGD